MMKQSYSDRKQIDGCLVVEWVPGRDLCKGEITKGHQETFRGDGYAHFLNYGGGFPGTDIQWNIKLHILNVCSLLCVNYTSIKLLWI